MKYVFYLTFIIVNTILVAAFAIMYSIRVAVLTTAGSSSQWLAAIFIALFVLSLFIVIRFLRFLRIKGRKFDKLEKNSVILLCVFFGVVVVLVMPMILLMHVYLMDTVSGNLWLEIKRTLLKLFLSPAPFILLQTIIYMFIRFKPDARHIAEE